MRRAIDIVLGDRVAALVIVTAGPDPDRFHRTSDAGPDTERNAEADPSADRPPDVAADSQANAARHGDAPADRDAAADITPEPPRYARFTGRQRDCPHVRHGRPGR